MFCQLEHGISSCRIEWSLLMKPTMVVEQFVPRRGKVGSLLTFFMLTFVCDRGKDIFILCQK